MASKSDVLIKLTLVFFISLLSFAIGTFVGKKYSDNQHKIALLEPENQKAGREIASKDSHDEGHEKSGSVSDQEIADLAKEFVDEESTPTTTAEAKHEESGHGEQNSEKTEKADTHSTVSEAHATEKAEKNAHEDKHEVAAHTQAPSQAAARLAQGQKATSEIKPAPQTRQPTSLPQDIAKYSLGKYTLQVAAYGSESEAKSRIESLRQSGYTSAFFIPAEIKGKTWYRVHVGLFATEKEAVDYRAEFAEKAKLTDVMVKKITQ